MYLHLFNQISMLRINMHIRMPKDALIYQERYLVSFTILVKRQTMIATVQLQNQLAYISANSVSLAVICSL